MITCMCGYESDGLVPMMSHLSAGHLWPPSDITRWMVQYTTDAIQDALQED